MFSHSLDTHIIFDEVYITHKICKYYKTMGIINRIMKPILLQRHKRLRLCKSLARSVLSYGNEVCTIRNKDISKITAGETRLVKRTAEYTNWDHKEMKIHVIQELQLEPIMPFINIKKCRHGFT